MELNIKDKRFCLVMISCIAWGLAAHGMAFFYKFSFHDDAMWTIGFADQETYGLGRWGLGVFGRLAGILFGSMHISTPAVNGIVCVLSIALMVYIICRRLEIDNKLLIISLSGVMVCFPAVTALFGFMYTVPYYFIGSVLGVWGAYIFYSRKNLSSILICIVFMTISVSLYQANIPINLMVLLLFMIDEVFRQDMSWKEYIILGVKNGIICAGYMIGYLIFNKVFLSIKDMGLSSYKGVDTFGVTSPLGYLMRVVQAYKRFLNPADYIIEGKGISANMFPLSIKYYHLILILITMVMMSVLLYSLGEIKRSIMAGVLVCISPLFAYFIYFMVGEPEVHGLMTYGEAFMFIIPVFVADRLLKNDKLGMCRSIKYMSIGVTALMIVIGTMFARYANVCYLKASVMQSEAVCYFNTLITRIQSTDGYTADTPVIYINDRKKNEESFTGNKMFDPIYLPPYQGDSIINRFSWEETMELWCGFSPVRAESDDEVSSEEIEKMPVYPDDGSVKMVNGVVVVKFAE